MEMKIKRDRPAIPRAYHAYLVIYDPSGKKHTCFFYGYDEEAWLAAEHLRYCAVLGGNFAKVHRWRGPMLSPADPAPSDMVDMDDPPW